MPSVMSDGRPIWLRLLTTALLLALFAWAGHAFGLIELTDANLVVGAVVLLSIEFLLPVLTAFIRKLLGKRN